MKIILEYLKILLVFVKKNAKLIHLSSTSVYGHQSDLIDEKINNLLPQTPYAEEKVLEEQYLKKILKN